MSKKLAVKLLVALIMVFDAGYAMAQQYEVALSGTKAFTTNIAVVPGSTVSFDIYLTDANAPQNSGGVWVDFSAANIAYVSAGVAVWDGHEGVFGNWDPVPSLFVNEPAGPGTLLMSVVNLQGAVPDGDGDIIVGRITLQKLGSADAVAQFRTIPGVATWAPIDDETIVPGIVTVRGQTSTSTTTILISPFCEGNLDCDQDVDGTDASTFKADFGRSNLKNPCLSLTDCPSNPWQPCPEGMITCGPFGFCADPMTDEANCGGCNVICSDTCVNGTCQQVGCPPNFTWCGSECADTTTDEANCGGCDITCNGKCVAGVCQQGNAPVAKTGQTTLYRTGDDGDIEAGVPSPNPRFTILYHYWFIAFNRACNPPTIECENPPNPNNDVVFDNLTGLYWLRDANYFGGTKTWDDAIDSAKSIPFEGAGWRLPNVKELQSLIDFSQYDPALPSGHPFVNVQSNLYWSGTSCADDPIYAWDVLMNDGYVPGSNKSSFYYVWPVRSDN